MWKNLPEELHLSRYQVSEEGQIRNKQTEYVFQTKVHAACGYVYVCVRLDDDTSRTKRLHRLIALTFLPNPENKPTVDHINRDRGDNRVENLRWATFREQNLNTKNVRVTCRAVLQLDTSGNVIQRWDGIREAEDSLGISHGKISLVCRGSRKTTGGYRWKYDVEEIDGEKWIRYNKNIEVSNHGRVRKKTGYIYYGAKSSGGYRTTPINPKTKGKVHRLVAKLFLPNPENLPVVNHKDGAKANNHVDNLEWMTHQDNCLHATRTGLNKRTKKLGKRVIQYTLEGIEIAKYNSLHDAHKTTGINRSSISKVCHGYLQKTNGFVFKFEDGKDKHRSHYKAKKRRILAIPLREEGPTFCFDSVSSAAEFIGTTPSNIYSICKGILPSSKGYTFEYIVDPLLE